MSDRDSEALVAWKGLVLSRIHSERRVLVEDFVENYCGVLEWEKQPASTRYHAAYPGGLLEHLAGVTRVALLLRETLAEEIPEESVVICAGLHDLKKIGLIIDGKPIPKYIPNPEHNPNTEDPRRQLRKDGVWPKENAPYLYNPEMPDVPESHIIGAIAAKWLPLSLAEWKAITFHDGQYIDENVQPYRRHQMEPLGLLIHFADMWSLQREKQRAAGAPTLDTNNMGTLLNF